MSTYFISDSHFGAGPDSLQREKELVAFLDSIEADCSRLIFLGDIFDFWFTYKYVVPKGHVRILGKLASMVDRGIEVHYFIGNHDMWLFDYLEKEIGLIVHHDPCNMTIDGKLFHLGHGDGLAHDITKNAHEKRYIWLKRLFRCRFNQRLFALINPLIGVGIALRWSDSSRKSHGHKYDHYLGDEKEGIVLHCRRQLGTADYDYFVFGHRHMVLEKEIISGSRKATYYNVGDWIDHRNYAKFDGTTFSLCNYKG